MSAHPSLRALLVLSAAMCAATGAKSPQHDESTLIFQTDHPWSPRTNINADTVMVYGIDNTVASRIQSWRDHGYRVTVMTGVAWGRYGSYLRGDFDGKPHWDETQQEKSGKLRLHGGREVPYVAPSSSYGRFLTQGVIKAIDAGAEAIYLEEPEFWANTGWSESFKREWRDYYHEAWQPPDSTPDAQYRASKLKYFLYRRALGQVFDAVRRYGAEHGRTIPCYVATHSLINYAQWQIVSPESSLLQVGADGYIAQVWTGTAREPNFYRGEKRERTFETAFLEYGALQNIARSSGKPIWYLNDPIEDNPHHSWVDYRSNWESTMVASLLQPAVARYEVLPWPDRIFGPKALRPANEPTKSDPAPAKTLIPTTYATELQTIFHALGKMNQPDTATRWQVAGSEGVGVLVSDSLMFQRADPQPSDKALGNFYGLALPLLQHGIPVEPVQIETASDEKQAGALDRYRVLLLTYEGQKPPSAAFHNALQSWVKSGGALVVVDDDKDPYNQAKDWWNSGNNHFGTPREHLFQMLGMPPAATGLHPFGKGVVLYAHQSPAALTYSTSGADTLMQLVKAAAQAIHLRWREASSLVLRRGPYVIAAGLDQESAPGTSTRLTGNLIDLFDANLTESSAVMIRPGRRSFLLDVDYFRSDQPCVLAASAKITDERATASDLSFHADGVDQTEGVIRILSRKPALRIAINGQLVRADQYQQGKRTILLHFKNTATRQLFELHF